MLAPAISTPTTVVSKVAQQSQRQDGLKNIHTFLKTKGSDRQTVPQYFPNSLIATAGVVLNPRQMTA